MENEVDEVSKNENKDFTNMIIFRDILNPFLIKTIYFYSKVFVPKKIAIVGENKEFRKNTIKHILKRDYVRYKKVFIGRKLEFRGPEDSKVYVIHNLLEIQTRLCSEIKDLFANSEITVICSIRNMNCLRPETRTLLNKVICTL